MPRPSILRSAGPLLVGRMASASLTFVLPLLLARALHPEEFGSYKQLFLVAQTVLLVGQFGLTSSLYYFLPRGGPERGAHLTQALGCLLLAAACAGLGLRLGGPIIAHHLGDGALARLTTPLSLLAAFLLVAAPLEASFVSEGRVAVAASCYVISDGTRALLLIAGARHAGLYGLAWGAVGWAGLRVVGLCVALLSGALPLARPRLAMFRTQLGYALPFAGSAMLLLAQRQLIQYAVAVRFDAATYALFSVAAFHLPVVDLLYTPIGEVLMVQIGRSQSAEARLAAWRDAVDKLASVLWPAAACAWLFGGRVLPLLFTSRYAAAVPLFYLTTLEIPFWVLPVDPLMRAVNETRFLFLWYAARLGLTATAVLGGMHLAGVRGAILGSVCSEAVSRCVLLLRGGSSLAPGERTRMLDPSLAWIALATVGAAAPAWLVEHSLPSRAGLFAGIAVFGAVHLAMRLRGRSRTTQAEPESAASA